MAKASAGEFRSQLYLAYDLSYVNKEQFEILKLKVNEVSKLISGLIKYLNSTL
ncbi:four helix bundle protein [Hyunsoonleella ulvae]|uniref:four helix bundle protein n=1 Tax=Hyunsoonleella ulvae TaxID=2799948 RepID=UPI00293D4596|nr:four helix bundle protein [Hyunsoonleella ulvae]